ncbi:hypothetical protein ACFLY2_02620 [Patescibacteria group bacterium]
MLSHSHGSFHSFLSITNGILSLYANKLPNINPLASSHTIFVGFQIHNSKLFNTKSKAL